MLLAARASVPGRTPNKTMAVRAGISEKTVSHLCCGTRIEPTLRVAFALKNSFGVDLDSWLIEESDQPTSNSPRGDSNRSLSGSEVTDANGHDERRPD
jgi:hypothetical protein